MVKTNYAWLQWENGTGDHTDGRSRSGSGDCSRSGPVSGSAECLSGVLIDGKW